MASAFEILSKFDSLRWGLRRPTDAISYLAWVLEQPHRDESTSFQLLHELFDYHKPKGSFRRVEPHVGRVNRRVWILPTDVDPSVSETLTLVRTLELLRVSAAIDLALKDVVTGTFGPLDNGYYVFVQFGDDDEGLVLMNDFSWRPISVRAGSAFKLPEVDDELKRLEDGYIFIEVDNATILQLLGSDTVEVGVAAVVDSYGPHIAVADVGGSFESAHEVMTELKQQDARFQEERDELLRDVTTRIETQCGADLVGEARDERIWDLFYELLTEDIDGATYNLSAWDAAGFTVGREGTLSGLSDLEVIDGQEVVSAGQKHHGSHPGTLVSFNKQRDMWEVWDARNPRWNSSIPPQAVFSRRVDDRPDTETTGHAGYVPNWLRFELIRTRLPNSTAFQTTGTTFASPIVRAPEYRVRLIQGQYRRWHDVIFYDEDAADHFAAQWVTEQQELDKLNDPNWTQEDSDYDAVVERIR